MLKFIYIFLWMLKYSRVCLEILYAPICSHMWNITYIQRYICVWVISFACGRCALWGHSVASFSMAFWHYISTSLPSIHPQTIIFHAIAFCSTANALSIRSSRIHFPLYFSWFHARHIGILQPSIYTICILVCKCATVLACPS